MISNARRFRGGRRHLPNAFTEQGVAMLPSVLRSKRAVMVNVEVMCAFAAAWPARVIVQEALAQITGYHNITLIEKLDAAIAGNLKELGYGG